MMADGTTTGSAWLPAPRHGNGWLSLDPVDESELPVIAALAERVWWQVYPPIIGAAQVHYMLGRGYALSALRADRRAGTRFLLYRLGPVPIGFAAWRPETGRGFIDKLYLLPSLHGCGLGRWLIEATCRQIAATGRDIASLRVNRHNRAAIRAYRRAGFAITATDCLPIGLGFVMDDYLMCRTGLQGLFC
ncbi:GNAT family N-acetyltransferase [Guyparkeria hydrothermalis]|uniref:GNAT family N-acetyltransferase n=1 Tax=Guyparkeria hydrothermalis TaxID=923 RepID=UPI002020C3A0|nr:GNAT family N-acetyltransferase [Guyparkeria hydrothermalis]MCL7744958.1 GNAT family N-acetyltransferase [Guyparkeria hydrothermalis]